MKQAPKSAKARGSARPGAISSAPPDAGGLVQLFGVRFQHGYYNGAGSLCPDFKVIATPHCAKLMSALGMVLRDDGVGFRVYVRQQRIGALIDYVRSQFRNAGPGSGYWSWLSFLLIPTNPLFIGITNLPITTSPALQKLHVSNLRTTRTDEALVLGSESALGAEALCSVTGPSVSVTVPSGRAAALTDLSGAVLLSAQASDATTASFRLGGLPHGYYSLAIGDDGSAARPSNLLYVPTEPMSLCLLDLLLTQPASGIGDPAAFPIPLLTPQSSGAAAATFTPTTVNLVLAFEARDTVWQYFVVSQGPAGQLASNLRISGGDPTTPNVEVAFAKTPETLPNGDQAVLFTSKTALQLRQSSPYRFKLSGQRQSAGGGRDAISIERLPTAGPAPVWPADGTDLLAGRSEIYVYV